MKLLTYFLGIALFFFINSVHSQDIITQKNGDEMEVKVTELSDDYVKFYYLEDPEKVEVKMNRSLIRTIEFEYGRKEVEVQPGLDESYYVDDHQNNILLNFTGIPSKTTMLSYEKSISPFASFGGGVKIHGVGAGGSWYEKSGFGVEANYKVKTGSVFKKDDYRPNHLLQGFYVRPNLGFTTAKFDYYPDSSTDDYEEYSYLHGGFDIGKEWVFNNVLSLDIYTGINFFGGDYTDINCETCSDDGPTYIEDGNMVGGDNTALRYGVQLGFTF